MFKMWTTLLVMLAVSQLSCQALDVMPISKVGAEGNLVRRGASYGDPVTVRLESVPSGDLVTFIKINSTYVSVAIDTTSADIVLATASCQGYDEILTCANGYSGIQSQTQSLVGTPCIKQDFFAPQGPSIGDFCDQINTDTPYYAGPIYKASFALDHTFADVAVGATLIQMNTEYMRAATGVLGLAGKSLSSIYKNTNILPVLDQLVSQKIMNNGFSICIPSDRTAGTLVLGGYIYSKSFSYSYVDNVSPKDGLYALDVTGVLYNMTSLNIAGNVTATIINTTSSTISFPPPVYDQIINLICPNGGCDPRSVKTFTFAELLAFPDITFMIGKTASQQISSRQYWIPVANTTDQYMLAITRDSGSSRIVLGRPFMAGKQVIFDRVNNRIGFQFAQCQGGIPVEPIVNIFNSGIAHGPAFVSLALLASLIMMLL
eukprot:Colp12_sorted_trinity150504_noHs@25990